MPRKTHQQPSTPQQAREWLAEAARHLTTWPGGAGSLRFVGSALRRFLQSSNVANVDKGRNLLYKELGLVAPPGRRSTFKERMTARERGRKIIILKRQRKAWHKIAEEVGLKDERTVKYLYEKALLEEQQLQLDHDISEFLKKERTRLLKPS